MLADINGTKLFYNIEGNGDPLMLMHGGLGSDHTNFKPWLNPLSKKFKVIYYDHRGNGRSARPPLVTLTHENFVSDAEELRKFLGLGKMILFGYSYGSFLALEYAIRYQKNLSHLIVVGTAPSYEFLTPCREKTLARLSELNLDTPENKEMIERWIVGEVLDEEEFEKISRLFSQFGKPHPESSEDTILDVDTFNYTIKNGLFKYDVRKDLDKIKVPTLIINGKDDWDTPIEQAELVHKGIPNSTFIVFEDSQHTPFADEPDRFNDIVEKWIKSTSK